MSYASKGVEVRIAHLNLDPGATCKVSDGAASGGKQEMLSMGQKIRNSWSGEPGCSYADEGRGDNGIQRASKKFNISRSREFIATICHSFLCPMLELRISGACKVALPEASSAVTPFVPKVLQCGGYIFVFRIFWELSSWKLQFEHVNLSGRFDFLHFLPRNLEQCVCVVNRQL